MTNEIQYRTASFTRAAINQKARTVELSFSSDNPIERSNCFEILDHSPGAADLTRIQGGPLLVNHDPEQLIGRVESAHILGRKGRATVRFSKSDDAEKIWQDVCDGIRDSISVGYMVNDTEQQGGGQRDGKPTYRVTKWEPLEISFASIPADTSVGVGRSLTNSNKPKSTERKFMENIENTDQKAALERVQEINAVVGMVKKRQSYDASTLAEKYLADPALPVAQFYREVAIEADKHSACSNSGVVGSGPEHGDPWQATRMQGGRGRVGDVGAMVANSPQFRTMMENGGITRNRGFSITLPVTGFATRTTTTSGLTSIEKMPGVVELGQRPLRIADLLSVAGTNASTVRYIQEQSWTDAATTVAEGAQKPEQAFNLAEVDAPVRKVAVFTKSSDELFADHSDVAGFINTRLAYAVERALEDQILNGDGVTPDLLGILPTPGIQSEARGTDAAIDAILKAITKIRSVGFFEPDGIVIHPTDWQAIRLAKDANNQYMGGGPFTGAYGNGEFVNVDTLWGKACVITPAIAQGTALVGSFKLGASLYVRQGLIIEMSNSDGSDFTQNLTTIRCELRAALAVSRPLAFAQVTGL